MIKALKSAFERRAHESLLRQVRSPEEVIRLSHDIGFTYFSDYAEIATAKRREFSAIVAFLGIDLAGKSVIDIGPGTGDSLDVARDLGAAHTYFIDMEPFFCRYLTLKGHEGLKHNYYNWPDFSVRREFDLVWTKGSINCEWVNDTSRWTGLKNRLRGFDFQRWVDALVRLTRRDVILVPAMGRRTEQIHDPELRLTTYYWCDDVEAYKNSYFSRTLVSAGFEMIEGVPGHNHPTAFPVTFHFRL